jgi:hypothetical protein
MALTQVQQMAQALAASSGGRVSAIVSAPSKVPGGYLPTGSPTGAPIGLGPNITTWAGGMLNGRRTATVAGPSGAVPVPAAAPEPTDFAPPTIYGGQPQVTQALTDMMDQAAADETADNAGAAATPTVAGFSGPGALIALGLLALVVLGGKQPRRRRR